MELKKSKLYTKTGDQGMTRLVGGSRVEKFNPRVEAYGCVDELNASLGVVRSLIASDLKMQAMDIVLEAIQNHLFRVGSILACEDAETLKMLALIEPQHITLLETQIDILDSEVPELKNFILPGGHLIASNLHIARTICRRAERRSVEVKEISSDPATDQCLVYLNRLSDYLFVASRWVNLKTSCAEVIWKKE